MLNQIGESGHPCVVLDLRRKSFNIECNVGCGFVMYGLYFVEVSQGYVIRISKGLLSTGQLILLPLKPKGRKLTKLHMWKQ